jgi:hypothetical protein
MCYDIIRKRDKGGNKMKVLNDELAKKFIVTCENIKNAQNSDDAHFYVGNACGIVSGLFLSGVIDIECYTVMHLYIGAVLDECKLGRGDY